MAGKRVAELMFGVDLDIVKGSKKLETLLKTKDKIAKAISEPMEIVIKRDEGTTRIRGAKGRFVSPAQVEASMFQDGYVYKDPGTTRFRTRGGQFTSPKNFPDFMSIYPYSSLEEKVRAMRLRYHESYLPAMLAAEEKPTMARRGDLLYLAAQNMDRKIMEAREKRRYAYEKDEHFAYKADDEMWKQARIMDKQFDTDKLRQKLNGLREGFKETSNAARNMWREQGAVNEQLVNFDKMMSIALGKLLRYRVLTAVGYGTLNFFQTSVKETTENLYEMTQIQKVMDEKQFDSNRLWQIASKNAIQYGISLNESLKGMVVWAQQGKNINEIEKLHNYTLLLSSVANLSTTESVEALTSATTAYKMELGETIDIIDVWMVVQAKHAVTAKDLASATQLIASAAQVVGEDYKELAADVTAIVAVTRKSGTAVANSLKSMFSRFARPASQKVLFEQAGIVVQKEAGTFKDFGTVMDELFTKWDTLNDKQKTSIAYAIGGMRQYTDFIALMDNYKEKLQSVAEAEGASGYAQKTLAIEMDSSKKVFAAAGASVDQLKLGIGSAFVGPNSTLVLAAKGFTQLGEHGGKAMQVLGKSIGGLSKFGVTLAAVATIRQLINLGKYFSVQVGESTIMQKAQNLVMAQTNNIRHAGILQQITQLNIMAGMVLSEEELGRVAQLSLTEQIRLRELLAQKCLENAYAAEKANMSNAGIAGRGFLAAIGGWQTLAFGAAIVLGDVLITQWQKAKRAHEEYIQNVIPDLQYTLQQIRNYDIYVEKIDSTISYIEKLDAAQKSGAISAEERMNKQKEAIEGFKKSMSGLSTSIENLGPQFLVSTGQMAVGFSSLDASSANIIQNLVGVRETVVQVNSELDEAYSKIYQHLSEMSEKAKEDLNGLVGIMDNFTKELAGGRFDIESIYRKDLLKSVSAGNLILKAALEGTPFRMPTFKLMPYDADSLRHASNLLIGEVSPTINQINSSLAKAASEGGQLVYDEITKVFPELKANIDLKEITEYWISQAELGIKRGGVTWAVAWDNIQKLTRTELERLSAQTGLLKDAMEEISKKAEDFRKMQELKGVMGLDVETEFQLIEQLQEKWESVMHDAVKIGISSEGEGFLGEVTKALGMTQEDRSKWIENQGKELRNTLAAFYTQATDLAIEDWINKGGEKSGTTVREVLTKLLKGFFEKNTSGIPVEYLDNAISLIEEMTGLNIAIRTEQDAGIARYKIQIKHIEEQVKLFEKLGITGSKLNELLMQRIDYEEAIAIIQAEKEGRDANAVKEEFKLSRELMVIENQYRDATEAAETLLDIAKKVNDANADIYKSISSIFERSPEEDRIHALETEIELKKMYLEEQRKINAGLVEEVSKIENVPENLTKILLKNKEIADIEGGIAKTEAEIVALEREMTLAPLLEDLGNAKKYFDEIVRQSKMFSDGIARAFAGLPSAIEANYAKRSEFLDEIKEKEKEIAELEANLNPSSEGYEQQLDYIEKSKQKIREAREDVKKWTGTLGLLGSMAESFMEDISKAYMSVIQEQLAKNLQKAILRNIEFDFHGQIISASKTGAELFYEAINKAALESYYRLTGTTSPATAGLDKTLKTGGVPLLAGTVSPFSNLFGFGTGITNQNVQEQTPDKKEPEIDWKILNNYLGVMLGTLVMGGKKGSASGAGFGGAFGSVLSTAFSWTGWGAFLAPVVGSILGGVAGSALSGAEKKLDLAVDKLEENTDATKENTKVMEQLSERLINAPSWFTIPALATYGGGGGFSGSAGRTGNTRRYLL
jgi:TP901 family phage tail tape measure protein